MWLAIGRHDWRGFGRLLKWRIVAARHGCRRTKKLVNIASRVVLHDAVYLSAC